MADILKYPGQDNAKANSPASFHPRIGYVNQGNESAPAHLTRFTPSSLIVEVNADLCLFSETNLVLSNTLTNGHEVRPLPVSIVSSASSGQTTQVELSLEALLLSDVRRIFELAGYTIVMASDAKPEANKINFG